MLRYNFQRLFTQRGVNNQILYLIGAGFTRGVASRIVNKKNYRLSPKQIETLCKAFNCSPNDLFEWTPDKPDEINGNNPLQDLIRNNSAVVDFKNFSAEIPMNKLPDFAKEIDNIKKEFLTKNS